MINELVLHDSSRLALERFKAGPSHGLLVFGPAGAGKATVALALIGEIIGPLHNHPYFLHISPDGNTISINEVRQLQEFVRLKTTGTDTWRRAILVENAHFMTIEAQNAFLKLLEEPPQDTLVVLTALNSQSLLPTITSRAQQITLKPVPTSKVAKHFADRDQAELNKAFHMSDGQIGLMTALLDKQQNQELLQYIEMAKQFLQMPQFDRLVWSDQFIKQKDSLEQLLWALLAVSKAALYQAGQKGNAKLVKRWQHTINQLLKAQDALPAHPLPKLLLTDLSLQL